MEIDVHGASSRTLTGEIGLLEIQNVFAEVSICPETMKLHLKSLRETNFEATVTRFEFAHRFRLIPGGSPSSPDPSRRMPTGPLLPFWSTAPDRREHGRARSARPV